MRLSLALMALLVACGTSSKSDSGTQGAVTDPACTAELAHDGIDQDCDGVDLLDADGDGHDASFAGGDDCDDGDPTVHPGATEVCYDGIDQDCGGDDDFDCDGDGVRLGEDCNDEDPAIYPGAEEVWYDGIDADCDGADDYDADGDGYRGVDGGGDDCDDGDATVHPGADEVWYDGVDQDCSGGSDLDADGDGSDSAEHGGDDCDDTDASLSPADADGDGVSSCEGDCLDSDPGVYPLAVDTCDDGIDQDCSGRADEGCPVVGLSGRTFVLDGDDLEIDEPELLADLAAEVLDAVLLQVEEQSDDSLHIWGVQGIDLGGRYDPMCGALVDVGWIDFTDNPQLVVGPTDLVLEFEDTLFTAWDYTLTGSFTGDGTEVVDLHLEALFDTGEVDFAIGFETCELALALGLPPCVTCPDGRDTCLQLIADAESAAWDPTLDVLGVCL